MKNSRQAALLVGLSLMATASIASADPIPGFTCSKPDGKLGMTCRGRVPEANYPEEVAIFIPASYHPRKHPEMILHLHGHRLEREHLGNRLENFDDVLHEFKFDEMLAHTKRDAILIVPSSLGKCETFRSYFDSKERFHLFLAVILEQLTKAKLAKGNEPGTLVLTAHSGGYYTVGQILGYARDMVSEIYFFDAAYQDDDGVMFPRNREFAARYCPPKRFASVYVKTEVGNEEIWKALRYDKRKFRHFRDAVLRPDVTTAELQEVNPAFVRGDTDHWGVVNKYFPIFLERSSKE